MQDTPHQQTFDRSPSSHYMMPLTSLTLVPLLIVCHISASSTLLPIPASVVALHLQPLTSTSSLHRS